jgi:glycosyltransferase involved in cell wall biosynthesis
MLAYPFPPVAGAGTFRTIRFVKYLPEFGWEPIVLTVAPVSVRGEPLDKSLDSAIAEDIIVHRTPIARPVESLYRLMKPFQPRDYRRSDSNGASRKDSSLAIAFGIGKPNFRSARQFGRSLRDLFFMTPDDSIGWVLPAVRASLNAIRRYRPQVVFSTGPPHTSHLIAVVVKRLTGLPIVNDFRDPWSRSDWHQNEWATLRGRLQGRLESICVRNSDHLVLNTTRLQADFEANYGDSLHVRSSVISNGFDPDLVRDVDQILACRRGIPRDDTVRLCHPGTVYGHRNLRGFLSALALLLDSGSSVSFDQIGSIVDRQAIDENVLRGRLSGVVREHGRLSHSETLRRMADMDVFVIVQPSTRLRVPAKLFEMLMFRKPILALTGPGATADIISEFDLGIVANPDDPIAIAEAIMLCARRSMQSSLTGRWQEAYDTFDGRRLTAKLADVCTSLL